MNATSNRRPRIRPERTWLDLSLTTAALAFVLASALLAIIFWPKLPDQIPTHFNTAGEPDGWGPRWVIWLLPITSMGLLGGLLGVIRYPWVANMPVPITEENAESQYRLVNRMLRILGVIVSLTFLLLVTMTIQMAHGRPSIIAPWVLLTLIGPSIVTIVWYLIAASRA